MNYYSTSETPYVAPDPTGRRGRRLGTAFLFLCSAIVLAVYLPQTVDGITARFWPTTPGRIVSQTVAPELLYVYVGRLHSHDVMERRLRVRYAYAVAGVPYVGASIGRAHAYVDAVASERARLAEGTAVTVHYDASNPADAVLDAEPPLGAIAWTLLGVAGLVWAERRRRRPAGGTDR